MGYHVYDLAEFSLSSVGRHRTYLYLFCQEASVAKRFAEDIGQDAVSISGGIDDVDWFFASDRPLWLSPHAYFYATICVICPRKIEAERFLSAYKAFRRWGERAAYSSDPINPLPMSLTRIGGVLVVSIPRTQNPNDADFMVDALREQASIHDSIMPILAKLVRTGLAREAAIRGEPKLLAERIGVLSRVATYVCENAVLVDSLHGAIVPINEQRKVVFQDIRTELSEVKKMLGSLPQGVEVQHLMHQLREINKALVYADWGRRQISEKVLVGIDIFGNGAKVLLDSNGISTNLPIRLRSLLSTLGSLHEPGAENRHLTKP